MQDEEVEWLELRLRHPEIVAWLEDDDECDEDGQECRRAP
jgi:hypothetical protein